MKALVAALYDGSNDFMRCEVFNSAKGYDVEEVLEFFVHTKAEFGHTVLSKQANYVLFSDGVRVVVNTIEVINIHDVKEFNTIKRQDAEGINGQRVQEPTDGKLLIAQKSVKKPKRLSVPKNKPLQGK